MKEKIFIASDHAGFQLKTQLINHFEGLFDDLGTKNDESVDYPEYAKSLVNNIIVLITILCLLINYIVYYLFRVNSKSGKFIMMPMHDFP